MLHTGHLTDANLPQSQRVRARLPLALPDEVAAFGLTQQLVGLFSGDHPVEPGRESGREVNTSKNQALKGRESQGPTVSK